MFKRKWLLALSFVLTWGVSQSANAAALILDGFVDEPTPTIDTLPGSSKVLMASITSTADKGGSDAIDTTVSIGGTVVAADVAEICVDYAAATILCITNPSPLTNIVIPLAGNQKGGGVFDYRVTLNSSAAGKTIQLTVESITAATVTDNIPLPQATALKNVVGAAPVLATVTSPTFASVTDTTATLGGNVTADGGAAVTDHGVVWNTSSPAETGGTVVSIGSGTGLFSQIVGSLPTGTLIYFKAYATNSVGTAYSAQSSFTTLVPAVPPTVTSPTFADVTDTTATLGGNVTSNGGGTVTSRGVEWGTAPGGPYPNSVPQGSGGTGIFTVPVTGMSASTTIYFRAWAINSAGTSFSTQATFTTTTPAVPPTVTAPTFTSVAGTSAVLGGTVSADGGATVTDRGVVWNTSSPAESGGTVVSIGSGTGLFSQFIGGLTPGTLIYFKAYATNTAGTSYSTESSFTTLVGVPTVSAPTVTSITATSAILGGNVTSDGGGTITDRGTVWGTSGNPTGNILSAGTGTGIFSHLRTGLPTGTIVVFRAYATNAAGTVYSPEVAFIPTGPPVVDTPTSTSITHKSAVLGGTVSSDGGAFVSDRGIVWNTSSPAESGGTVASMLTGTGIFSQDVSNLPLGTLIYFKAYATNASGTSYSIESSFTTGTEPTVQASNITFPQVAGKSMRISWTRGDGDGSIVVLRLLATTKVDPTDLNDYTPNPDFTLAQEIPTGNFVVHKSSSNTVLVTGLSLNTTYSVAIYEYTGTGASTYYLQSTPAEASQATTDTPVHNMDNRAICDDCHNHSEFFTRDAELKTICETCHNATGPAAAKLEFDNHLPPGKNPAVDFVDCGRCHELHNPGGPNTTKSLHSIDLVTRVNKSFLRANVDKYITTASAPAYLHTDQPLREIPHPDAPLLADTPDRAVEGGDDTTARGYCQVCHTLTNNHRSTNTAGSDQCHDGESNTSCTVGAPEVNCGKCHQHKSRFAGIGGTASCVSCHDSQQGALPRPIITTQFDRLSSHITAGSGAVAQEDCMVCHDQQSHQTQTVRLWDADSNQTISYAQSTAGTPTISTGQGEAYAPGCLSCHDADGASSLAGVDQTPLSPFIGSTAPPIIDSTLWASASHNRPVATSGTSPVTCIGDGSNGCHGSGHGSDQLKLLAPAVGAAVSPADFCLNCHDADGPSSINILAQFTPASPEEYTGGSNYVTVNKKHDIFPADQTFSGGAVSCKNCHNPHTANNAMPAKNPDTGTALGTYSTANSYSGDSPSFTYDSGSGTDLDPTNPVGTSIGGPFVDTDYIEFCLTCHDGTAPPGVVLPATMLNIAVAFATTDQHGNLIGNGSASRGYLKAPWATDADVAAGVQPAPYAAMNCTMCHGPHGSDNIYNLRSSITVAGVQMQVGALNAWEGESGTTYTLPLNGSTQEQFGWGAWCTFCHEVSHDTKTGLGCQSGHTHGGGNF